MFSSTLFVFCRIYCLHVFCNRVCFHIIVVTMTRGLFVFVVCVYMFFCFVCCLHAHCCTVFCCWFFVYYGLYYLFSVYMFVFMLCLLILLVVVCCSVVACLYLMCCLDLNVCLLWSRITWRNVNIQRKQYISALFKNIIKKL